MNRRRFSSSERFYAALLRLYPSSLRREYGADMRQAFRDTLREEARCRGRRGVWRAWSITLRDLAGSLPREWSRELPRYWPVGRPRQSGVSRRVRIPIGGYHIGRWISSAPIRGGFRLAPAQRARLAAARTRSETMNQKFDKFTERARHVLALSQEEAQGFGHNYIGTEHLLLGLIREEQGVGAKALINLGVSLEAARNSVEFIIGRGDHIVLGEIGLTPRSKKVFELAVDEAHRLNHHYIGTEHLLLGILREGSGIAAGVLESLGVNLERARKEVMRMLSAHVGSVVPDETSAEDSTMLAATMLTLVCRNVAATRAFYVDFLGAAAWLSPGPATASVEDADALLRMPHGGLLIALRAADPASADMVQVGAGAVEIGFYTRDVVALWNDLSKRGAPHLSELNYHPKTPRLRTFTLTDPDGRSLRFRGVFKA
jgi:hypothetical protein